MISIAPIWLMAATISGAVAVGFDADHSRYAPAEIIGWGERFWLVCVGDRRGPTSCASDKDAAGSQRLWLDAKRADRVLAFACGPINPQIWSPGPLRLVLAFGDGSERVLEVRPVRHMQGRAWFVEQRTCNWVTWRSSSEIAKALREEVRRAMTRRRLTTP